ncbi:hypothetical protein IMZ48_11380 [Candidatus Bathyarchaeota archaeon]|nr:hypothetical protein [Candidatus Bathyarchaeota archaeon]
MTTLEGGGGGFAAKALDTSARPLLQDDQGVCPPQLPWLDDDPRLTPSARPVVANPPPDNTHNTQGAGKRCM